MNLPELKAIALAATPGTWTVTESFSDVGTYSIAETFDLSDQEEKANATHIATFNPALVLRLLEDYEAMKAALENLNEVGVSDGCGGYLWRDDSVADAMLISRECLAALKVGKSDE